MVCCTGDEKNWRWITDCRIGHRKLGLLNCESGGGSANIDRAHWSESLRSTPSPPPAPIKKDPTRYDSLIASPPKKY